MKKKDKTVFFYISKAIICMALMVTAINVNSTCMFYINQPSVPVSARKFRRF